MREKVRSLAADVDGAKRILAAREIERAAMERAARENFEHAKRCQQELGAVDDDDLLSPKNALHVRYGFDQMTAANVVELLGAGGSLDGLHDAVAAFGENWGDWFDAAHVSYAASTVRRRRRRRVRRGTIRGALAAAIAAGTLLLDQAIGSVWAFTGSATLATLAFIVDPYIDRVLDKYSRHAQIRDLVDAIRRSENLLEELMHRESQFNGIRA